MESAKELIDREVVVVKDWWKKTVTFFKHLGNVLLIAVALVAGFFIGYYYFVFIDKTAHHSPMKEIRTIHTTSIAISERNELLLLNRVTGDYTVYQDSVGLAIFNMYAQTKYNQVNNPASAPAATKTK